MMILAYRLNEDVTFTNDTRTFHPYLPLGGNFEGIGAIDNKGPGYNEVNTSTVNSKITD